MVGWEVANNGDYRYYYYTLLRCQQTRANWAIEVTKVKPSERLNLKRGPRNMYAMFTKNQRRSDMVIHCQDI